MKGYTFLIFPSGYGMMQGYSQAQDSPPEQDASGPYAGNNLQVHYIILYTPLYWAANPSVFSRFSHDIISCFQIVVFAVGRPFYLDSAERSVAVCQGHWKIGKRAS
jgi:hypothetical protein